MNLKRKLICGGMLVLASMALTGCGGIQGSHSISPASFLLPGLIYNEPVNNDIETQSEADSIAQTESTTPHSSRI